MEGVVLELYTLMDIELKVSLTITFLGPLKYRYQNKASLLFFTYCSTLIDLIQLYSNPYCTKASNDDHGTKRSEPRVWREREVSYRGTWDWPRASLAELFEPWRNWVWREGDARGPTRGILVACIPWELLESWTVPSRDRTKKRSSPANPGMDRVKV